MERRRGRGRARVRHQEDVLAAHLAELKADLSACKDARTATKLASSLGGVKPAEEYARDRQRNLHAVLQVESGREARVHCDVMREDCDLCSKPPYTPDDLPLALHQFYCDRVSELIQLRHTLMVRWARFAGPDTKVAEEFYHHFQQRIEYLLFAYNDALHRARRLAASHTLTMKTTPTVTINNNDVMIYLRWLVTHLLNTKTLSAFIANIPWLPALYRNEFVSTLHPPTTSHPSPSLRPSHPVSHTPKPAPSRSSLWLSAAAKELLTTSTHHTGTASTSHSLTTDHTHHTDDDISRDHVNSHVTNSDITRDHVTMASSLGGSGLVGGASDSRGVVSKSLPLHTTDVHSLKDLLQDLKMKYGIRGSTTFHSPADELQLFYEASHKFQTLLPQQEATLSPYDSAVTEEKEGRGGGGGGGGGGNHCSVFTKPANWVNFVQIFPEPDPSQIITYARIRDSVKDIDPLLSLSSLTSHLHTPHRAMLALRQHAVTVKQPSLLPPLTTGTPHTSHNNDITLVWKCLYMGLDSRNPINSEEVNSMETDAMDTPNDGSHEPSLSVREATKVLSNERGRGVSTKASSVAKDAYFSFLLLRHLNTRDMRTTCLSILNYFRSVERTLTISHRGLSMESGQQQPTRSGGLLTHHHLHNTPADYIIDEAKFMQFTEVENHDDFYEFFVTPEVGRGTVAIWDPQGVNIVYDVALEDLREIENELLIIGTYYIQRGCGLGEGSGTTDAAVYSRRDADRMAVLHDLWTSEARYQDNKMKLVNCYLECYHHVSNPKEREKMAKVIITLMRSRPHYDPDSTYFTTTFDLECQCLEAHRHIVRAMVTVAMEEERNHSNQQWEGRHYEASENVFGLGLPPPPSHPVSLTGQKLLLPPSSLLEVLPSLTSLSSLPLSLHTAVTELSHHHQVTSSPTLLLSLHLKLLEVALIEWEEHRTLGAGYTDDVIHNAFSGGFVEDASAMCALGKEWAGVREKGGEGRADKQTLGLQAWCDILQLITLRHHLLLTSSESKLLTRHYKQLLATFKHDEYHAHLRCVPFDPTMRSWADKPLEHFISKLKNNDLSTSLDRYTPGKSSLAVIELDEKHIATFSFRSRDQVMELLSSHNGLLKLQTTLKAQVVHTWCLVVASLTNTASLLALEGAGGPVVGGQRKPAGGTHGVVTTASEMGKDLFLKKTMQKAFVSVQLEKVPVRDHMLAGLASTLHSTGKSQNDVETAKCSAIGQFCCNLVTVMSQYSLRCQILQLCQSLLLLLEHFPTTRDCYFTIGQISTNQKPVPTIMKDPRSHLSRPRALLSNDGSTILNLWYIPHITEVLTMFSEGTLDHRLHCLRTVLNLLSPLLILLHYHTAYVRLGTFLFPSSSSSSSAGPGGGGGGVGGNWGGTEGVGSVVQQLQVDIAALPDPSDPHQVSEYLQTLCQLLYFQHTLTIKHYLQRTFLLHGNLTAVRTLRSVSIPTLSHLTASSLSPSSPPSSRLPILPPNHSNVTQTLLPWQHFLSHHGPTPSLLDHVVWETGNTVMAGLVALSSEDRVTANGELLGLSLVLEEVTNSSPSSSHGVSPDEQRAPEEMAAPTSPLKRAKLIKEFLIISLQLEILREEWSLQVVGGGGHCLSSQLQCRQLDHAFRERVVGVARREVAKQQSHNQATLAIDGDALDESISQSTTFLTEGGVSGGGAYDDSLSGEQLESLSESKLRRAQVARLLELLELGLIQDTLRHVSRFHHLVMLEQNRDISTLPLDLWKMSPSMKEPAGVPRPHIVDRFLSQFHAESSDSGAAYTISKKAFLESIHQLSSDVFCREKETFQLYTGHYEGLVRSLYSQLYQRERQVEMWRGRAGKTATDSRTEALVTASELAHTSLLEVTALRVRIKELEKQLQTQQSQLRKTIQQEYSSLIHNLLSTCSAITGRYEDYRQRLYSDVLHCVQEVRKAAAVGVARAKESHGSPDETATTRLCSSDMCDIQHENAILNRMLLKQRAISRLHQSVRDVLKEREVERWREECDSVRRGEVEERMVKEVEINSLQAQINCLQKRLCVVERERDSAQRELAEERETAASTSGKWPPAGANNNKQQSGPMTLSSKAVSTKVKQLTGELEEKERQISLLENSREKQHHKDEEGHRRLTHQLQVTKQQLEHERHLKREAFHRVDDLLNQVHDLEDQQHVSLRALHSGRRLVSSSTPHSIAGRHHHTPHYSTPHTPHYSTPHTRRHSVTSTSAAHSRPDSWQRGGMRPARGSHGLAPQNSE